MSVQELCDKWLEWDKNPSTRAEIQALLDSGNNAELEKRMLPRIAFGTAGLRGRMEAGFSGMNDLTVIQASQGLCVYIQETHPDTSAGIIVGYDGRHNSKRFAELTAATFLHKDIPVYLFDSVIPTPLVAFGVTNKKCMAGIVITASHNPKADNGYKVYWNNGCQISFPVDVGVTKGIQANLVPWPIDVDNVYSHSKLKAVNEEVVADYMTNAQKWCFNRETNAAESVKITYTAMHGVGLRMAERVYQAFGLNPFIQVKEQVQPDPEFPTVEFPNPEEGEGALRLAMETADAAGSTVIVANDPDADRLALAEKIDGKWNIYNGNEIGALIAQWAFTQYAKHHPGDSSKLAVVNSTVSSKLLSSLAQKEGLYYEETLTGFKNIGGLAGRLREKGYTILMGFEEAIGYMIGDTPLDKDGISALGVVSEMAHFLYANNKTLYQQLQESYQRYGYYITKNKYFFAYDTKIQPLVFKDLRNDGKYHSACGPYAIKNVRDLQNPGYDSATPDHKPLFATSSSGMITYYFENGAVVTLRGSGTEPKLKYYAEMSGTDEKETRRILDDLVAHIITEFLQPEKYGLIRPV